MEINVFVRILEIIVLFSIMIGSMILANYVSERNGILALFVFVAGFVLNALWGRFWIGAEVWTVYPDHHFRRSEWLFEFRDSAGNRFGVERGKRYMYYDRLGNDDVPEAVELTVFPVYYTTDESKIGLPVRKRYYTM